MPEGLPAFPRTYRLEVIGAAVASRLRATRQASRAAIVAIYAYALEPNILAWIERDVAVVREARDG